MATPMARLASAAHRGAASTQRLGGREVCVIARLAAALKVAGAHALEWHSVVVHLGQHWEWLHSHECIFPSARSLSTLAHNVTAHCAT